MSKLEVDKIDPQSGTNLELGTSGDTVTIPTGVTLDASNATTTLPSNIVTTDGSQTLTNKNIAASQLTGTVATSNLGTGTADSTTFLRGDQTYASATPAADSITTSQLAYNPNPFRNIIINGDMSIAQRGTSETGITTEGYYTVDRFIQTFSNGGTWTQSQDTDVPSGQGFSSSIKLDCTTADTDLGTSGFLSIGQRFEGQNLQYLKYGTSSAESLTLSFWVKSNKTGTYTVEFQNIISGTDRINCQEYTISSSDTWEKKTITIDGDTVSGKNINNDNSLSFWCQWWLGGGTNYTSGTLQTSWGDEVTANRMSSSQVNLADSTSNEWYITGVQLEAGTSASDFEFLPVDVNLQRCYRYCYRINGNATDEQQVGGAAWCSTTSRVNHVAEFNPPLRAVPTITSSSDIIETVSGVTGMSTGGLFDDNQSGLCNTVGVAIEPSSGTPFTASQVAFPRLSASTSSFIQYDAEL